MLNAETEALRLVAQQMILDAEKQRRDAEMDLNTHLVFMSNCSQSHVWDKIDFYSRPAAIEAAERDGWDLMESDKLFIEFEDFIEPVNAAVIEDYYEGGEIWSLA